MGCTLFQGFYVGWMRGMLVCALSLSLSHELGSFTLWLGVWSRHLLESYGPLTKHVNSFGTLCKIMIGLSGNGLSWIRKRPWAGCSQRIRFNFGGGGGGVKGLIMTPSNLVVTWKVRPHDICIISWFPFGLCWSSQGGCSLVPFSQLFFQIFQQNTKIHCESPWDSSKGLYDGQIIILLCLLVMMFSSVVWRHKPYSHGSKQCLYLSICMFVLCGHLSNRVG